MSEDFIKKRINDNEVKEIGKTNIGYLRVGFNENEEYCLVHAVRNLHNKDKIYEYISAGLNNSENFFKTIYNDIRLLIKQKQMIELKDFNYEDFKEMFLEYLKKDGIDKHLGHTEQRIISCLESVGYEEISGIEIYTNRPCCIVCAMMLIGFKNEHPNINLKIVDSDLNYDVFNLLIDTFSKYTTNIKVELIASAFNEIEKYKPIANVVRHGKYKNRTKLIRELFSENNIDTDVKEIGVYENSVNFNSISKEVYRFDSRSILPEYNGDNKDLKKLHERIKLLMSEYDVLCVEKFKNNIEIAKLEHRLQNSKKSYLKTKNEVANLNKKKEEQEKRDNSFNKLKELMPGMGKIIEGDNEEEIEGEETMLNQSVTLEDQLTVLEQPIGFYLENLNKKNKKDITQQDLNYLKMLFKKDDINEIINGLMAVEKICKENRSIIADSSSLFDVINAVYKYKSKSNLSEEISNLESDIKKILKNYEALQINLKNTNNKNYETIKKLTTKNTELNKAIEEFNSEVKKDNTPSLTQNPTT